MPVATHLLESHLDEHPAAYFRDVAGPRHGRRSTRCAADAEDIALFAELDVPVVHCPRSNALLGCGIAPLPALREAGVRVGLGTDSPASALTLDMWDEMRAAILLARGGAGRPDVLTAATCCGWRPGRCRVRSACDGWARCLRGAGRPDRGRPRDTPFLPWDDPEAAAVYGGSPERVVLTMVAGRIRFRRRRAADTSQARAVRARMIEA